MIPPRIQLDITPERPGMYHLNLSVDGQVIRMGIYRRAEVPQVLREGMEVVGELVLVNLDATSAR